MKFANGIFIITENVARQYIKDDVIQGYLAYQGDRVVG